MTNNVLSGAMSGTDKNLITGPMVAATLGLSGFSVELTEALSKFAGSQKLGDFELIYDLFEKIAAEADILYVEARSAEFVDANGDENTAKNLAVTLIKKLNDKHVTYQRAVLERPFWTYASGPTWAKETFGVIWREDLAVVAAKVVAETFRLIEVMEWAEVYPQYGFEFNAGFVSYEHLRAIRKCGSVEGFHRESRIDKETKSHVKKKKAKPKGVDNKVRPFDEPKAAGMLKFLANAEDGDFTSWQRDFVRSVAEQFEKRKSLSPKQMYWLEKTYNEVLHKSKFEEGGY